MAAWLKRSLKLEPEPSNVRAEAARPVTWGDRTVVQPARWSASFTTPGASVRADYWVGNSYVTVNAATTMSSPRWPTCTRAAAWAWLGPAGRYPGRLDHPAVAVRGAAVGAHQRAGARSASSIASVSLLLAGGLALAGL
jgi:hypothetical protein